MFELIVSLTKLRQCYCFVEA